MKTRIIFWLCCCISYTGFSQSIDDIEYFFNLDPGFGNATSITPTLNSGDLTQTLSIPTGSLTGFNSLYIRAQDNLGVWTMYEKRQLYITDFNPLVGAAEITAAEYFFNTDLGFGGNNPLPVDPNTGVLNQSYSITLPGTLTGFNSLYIRTQDDLGVWSLYEKRNFYITDFEPLVSAGAIEEAEYFFNIDPGFGNGEEIIVDPNSGDLTQIISLPVGLLQGFNSLYIRTKDDLGEWSLYEKRIFYVEDDADLTIPTITGAEYFYDSDPGFGNGTLTTITATGNPNEFLIDLGTTEVSCDFHDFYIRLQNSDGTWSLYDYSEDLEVFDNADPTIVVFPNITAELDVNGQASITLTDVDNGTFDDCELVSVVLNQPQFDYSCDDLGINSVTITATDAEAKVSSQDVEINVVDLIEPIAVAKDIIIQLDSNGEAVITGDQIDNGSTDNCSVTGYDLDITDFDCNNLGNNTVTLTVTDQSGNSSTNAPTAIVTIEDNIDPNVVTQNITVQLDGTGNATINADQIDNGSSDNCTIDSKSLDISSFDCTNLGPNNVTLTVTDTSGNSQNSVAIVTVEDNINPSVNTQNITVQLDVTGNISISPDDIDNGSTDNCSIENKSIDISSFNCTNLGPNNVTLTITDTSGNSQNSVAIVTVEDNINPTVNTQNITVQLDATGNVSVSADDIDNGSSDNCSIDNKSINVSTFDCTNIGPNNVTLTVTDSSGNSQNSVAIVTVEDNTNPTVVTQNITVQLDATGNVSIGADDIDNGSSDNCTIDSKSINISSFNCSNLGPNNVTLTVTDSSGNSQNSSAIVTVEDMIDPTVVTQNITVQLDATGNASISADDIDNGSTDNCSIANKTLDISDFDCTNLGVNNVTLTITDLGGNSQNDLAIVTVEDNIDPIALGQDITVDLAGNPSVTITANDVDNGSSDNCAFTLSIDVDTFNDEGDYPVVLTVTDSFGNEAMTIVTVTVEDSSLGIDEFEISSKNIRLYPIPFEDVLHISTKLDIEVIDIYDLTGKHIAEMKNPDSSINLSHVTSGIYFLRFKVENVFIMKRIIKE